MYKDFSSFPPEEEKLFEVYEARMQDAARKSYRLGLVISGAFFGFLVLLVIVGWGPLKPMIAPETGPTAPAGAAAVAPAAAPQAPAPEAPAAPAREATPEPAAPAGGY